MSSQEDASTAAIQASRQGGAKTSDFNLTEATRRRATAAASIRDKKKLELMTQRRKECDTDEEEENNNNSSNNKNNNNGRSGYHASYEQVDRQEAYENIERYIMMCNPANNSPDDVRKAVFTIRSLLMQEEPNPVPKFRDFDGIEAFVNLLSNCPDLGVQFEVLWALSNIVTCSDDACDHVVRAGAVPVMINFLVNPEDEKLRRQAAWVLGNISGAGSYQRQNLLDKGCMKALLAALNGDEASGVKPFDYRSSSTIRNMAWLLAQLCRFKPAPPFEQVAICMPTVLKLLAHNDVSVRSDAAWAVSFLSDGAVERLRGVYDAGLIPPLLALFATKEERFALPCLRVFGNYSAKDETTHLLFEWEVIDKFHPLLDIACPRQLRKEAVWILSNCVCGTEKQIHHILDLGLMPLVVSCIGHPEYEIKKEAAWTIANLAQYAPLDVIRYLVETCGSIDALCHLMSAEEERSSLLALEALEPILIAGNQLRDRNEGRNPYSDRVEEQGGANTLENLVNHISSSLSLQALTMLDTFFAERARKHLDAGDGDGYCDYGNDIDEPQPQQQQERYDDGYQNNRNNNNDNNSNGGGYQI